MRTPPPGACSLVLLTLTLCALGIDAQGDPSTQPLPIEQIKKTVLYLQGDFPCHEPHIENGVQTLAPDGTPVFDSVCPQVGTGFLVNYMMPELGPNRGIPLLVTSKHLIQHQRLGAPKGTMEYFDSIVVLANALKPNPFGSYITAIQVTVKDRGFLFCSIDNDDIDADVAVCPLSISDSEYDIEGLSPDMAVTRAKIHSLMLNETDEVLFSGLFLPYSGAKRNYPIVRHGRIALIPEEKIPWSTASGETSMQDLYLAELTSWGGNSGSPVFVRLSGVREQGGIMAGVQYHLLGIMQGYFNSDRPATLDTSQVTETAHVEVKLSDNSGIAAVVPAEKILDVLAQPRVRGWAALIRGATLEKAGKTADAEASFKQAIDVLRAADPGHPLLKQAILQYAQFLRESGRNAEAGFQFRLANAMNATSRTPDAMLR
jgi:hypothetical protein